jgi:hypothetical protein
MWGRLNWSLSALKAGAARLQTVPRRYCRETFWELIPIPCESSEVIPPELTVQAASMVMPGQIALLNSIR